MSGSDLVSEFDLTRPVVVLSGGPSAEREVSLRSGNAVLQALQSAGIDVRHCDPAEASLESMLFRDREVAFVALHGPFGEDGVCQEILLTRRVPFTGTRSPKQLALAMDKWQSRELVQSAGGAVACGMKWSCGQTLPEDVEFPCVVKPNSQGSSVGVVLVRSKAEFESALHQALLDDSDDVIVESFVEGDEWTVAVLGDRAFPPVLVQHAASFFDHEAKYTSSSSRALPLTDSEDPRYEPLLRAGLLAHRALGLGGLTRSDFIWSPTGPVFLEINAIPGMTERSLAPVAAKAAGVSFLQLCLTLLTEAVVASDG